MNKGIVGLMVCACVFLGGTVIFLQMKEDKKPPTIQFQENGVTYVAGDAYDSLLAGVTAFDDRDGDVTDTLVVESVYPEENEKKATVIYVARDKSNNIGKAKREIAYQGNENTALFDADEEIGDGETESGTAVTESSLNGTGVQNIGNINVDNGNNAEVDVQYEGVQDANPHIKLTTDHVSIKAGDSINRITLVDSITDDKDDSDQLWGSIRIVGDEFDSNVPGVYEQIYYVVDSDGNRSNEEMLTITVE